ncbi:MAG: Flp pilus assembly protein CpaB [Gammaproteobacteria bacterium]|nr:Flp pilus assembly protein CpaB [Gammaproteobacteria bacterium]
MNYETRKNLWLIAIALLFAALAATLATRWMKSRVAAADAGNKNLAAIVVTARDVPMGKRLEGADVRLVSTAKEGVPTDAYHRTEDVVGQVSRSPFYAGEMLIQRRLSQYSGGSALAAVVAPDMRAVTVRVDDVLGVGGFILPENRVDVIAAFQDASGTHAETILRDARVLAVDQRSNPESDGPLLVRAVTLEVTPSDAEKIAAARKSSLAALNRSRTWSSYWLFSLLRHSGYRCRMPRPIRRPTRSRLPCRSRGPSRSSVRPSVFRSPIRNSPT